MERICLNRVIRGRKEHILRLNCNVRRKKADYITMVGTIYGRLGWSCLSFRLLTVGLPFPFPVKLQAKWSYIYE